MWRRIVSLLEALENQFPSDLAWLTSRAGLVIGSVLLQPCLHLRFQTYKSLSPCDRNQVRHHIWWDRQSSWTWTALNSSKPYLSAGCQAAGVRCFKERRSVTFMLQRIHFLSFFILAHSAIWVASSV
jgi:hypothetical protein